MNREEKNKSIEEITSQLNQSNVVYLTDTKGLDAETTYQLRKECFNNNIQLKVVKNTLLKIAMEKADASYEDLYDALKGNTSLMIAEVGNMPAKVIKKFRNSSDKPILKAAFIHESHYLGDENLDALAALKSKEEVIGDIILLLQSPIKNVVSGLQSSKGKLGGILKTLSERQ